MNNTFHSTMSALEATLTCDLIASRIDFDTQVPPEKESRRILSIARENAFDHVIVSSGDSNGRKRAHRVAVVDRKNGSIKVRDIQVGDLISANTPISEAIRLLAEQKTYFVLNGDMACMVLTRADLNKLPVQVFTSTTIAHLEVLLARVISRLLPNDTWLDKLETDDARDEVRRNHKKLARHGYDTTLIDNTGFSDKIRIVQLIPDADKIFRRQPSDLVSHLVNVRNRCFHGQELTNLQDVKRLSQAMELAHDWITDLARFLSN